MKTETSEYTLTITCDPTKTNLIVNMICQLLHKFSKSLGNFSYELAAKPSYDEL